MNNRTMNKIIKVFKTNANSVCRLFCFPFAGGSASFFRDWQNISEQNGIELCAIQMPGREDRIGEGLFTDVDKAVTEIVEAMIDFQDKPYAFFGHSMGTLISFEVTRKLRLLNMRQPDILFVSSGKAPHIQPRRMLHKLSDECFLLKINELGGIPDIILENQDLINLYLPILRADFKMIETYQYTDSQPLDINIVAYGGRLDREVRYQDIAAWEGYSVKPFSIHVYEGDHFYLRNHREVLLQDMFMHIGKSC